VTRGVMVARSSEIHTQIILIVYEFESRVIKEGIVQSFITYRCNYFEN
jgi:hypothetical protein